MEPLTHLLTGACLGRAGLNRKTALATTTLVLAAEVPDLDVIEYFFNPVRGFAGHRGMTHTFLGVPFDAALVVGAVYGGWRLYQRRFPPKPETPPKPPPRWGRLYAYACIGVLSHILLDFTNNYGVRPFAPFSWRWYSWDIVSIIEPALLAVLLIGLLGPFFFGLINEEIGARRRGPRGRAGAIFALTCMVLLWGFRDFEHRKAVAALEAWTYEGLAPDRVSAYPYMLDPFSGHGVVETKTFYDLVPVDSGSGEVDPKGRARLRYKPEETPEIMAAKKSQLGGAYLDWAQYPLHEVERDEATGDTLVRFYDLRFAYPERRTPLTASVLLGPRLDVLEERFGSRVVRVAPQR